jgi:hypothetical protein
MQEELDAMPNLHKKMAHLKMAIKKLKPYVQTQKAACNFICGYIINEINHSDLSKHYIYKHYLIKTLAQHFVYLQDEMFDKVLQLFYEIVHAP